MVFEFRHKIAFKQAKSVLLISVLLGLVFTVWQLHQDLEQERLNSASDIQRVIQLHQESAARSIYNLDLLQAKETTDSLISHPAIYMARLEDDFGDQLASSIRNRSDEREWLTQIGLYLFEIEPEIKMELQVGAESSRPAILSVELDRPFIVSEFVQRAVRSLVIGIVRDVALAFILLWLFYRYLSRPIVHISEWINSLRSEKKTGDIPYLERDEIGDLVRSFDSLWQEKQAMTEQLNSSIRELTRSEHFSRTLMENAGDAMFLCSDDTSIVMANRQACESLGVGSQQIVGTRLSDYSQSYSHDELSQLFDSLSEKRVTTFEDIQRAEADSFPIEARGIKVFLEEQSYLLILARDITARKAAEEQIYELAYFDTLTGLANRRLFIDRLTSSVDLHRAKKNSGAVLYLDLDRFKTINDSLGHPIGDQLLRQIARRLQDQLPAEATCGRLGGDEFVVLLPEVGSNDVAAAEYAAHLAETLVSLMAIPFEVDNNSLYCTASIGISVFPEVNENAADILRQADTALYRAKALGRNGYQFFDTEMQSSAQLRMELEKGLHQAYENEEFELWYQPQVDEHDNIIGVEALIRWRHPEKGIIAPGEFISVAEESGQIIEIGNWVLEQSIQQLSIWLQQPLPKSFHRLAINISPLQFMQVDFVERVNNLLDKYALPGHMVELEITENMLLNNFEVACNKMKLLKQKGVSFAIDDFGTGYSSLKYLRHLPLDILKIDRSFVTDLHPHSELAAIVEVIIATADRLALVVIAEGVETEKEKETLLALGCHCFQGYLYSKPIPAAQITALLGQPEKSTY